MNKKNAKIIKRLVIKYAFFPFIKVTVPVFFICVTSKIADKIESMTLL